MTVAGLSIARLGALFLAVCVYIVLARRRGVGFEAA
jgi:hypothetical protein